MVRRLYRWFRRYPPLGGGCLGVTFPPRDSVLPTPSRHWWWQERMEQWHQCWFGLRVEVSPMVIRSLPEVPCMQTFLYTIMVAWVSSAKSPLLCDGQ